MGTYPLYKIQYRTLKLQKVPAFHSTIRKIKYFLTYFNILLVLSGKYRTLDNFLVINLGLYKLQSIAINNLT